MQQSIVVFSWLTHARSCHTLKQTLNFLSTVSEVIGPEVVAGVLDQFNESDQQSPGMWPVDNQALQQDTSNLLLDDLLHNRNKAVNLGTNWCPNK